MAVSRKEEAYALIRKEILGGALKPGEIVNEHTFIDMVGCSRTPVREAMALLSEEGLIKIMPSRGMVVAPISVGDILMVYQARQTIEPEICRMLAEKPTFTFKVQVDEDEDEDTLFHYQLALDTGNRYLSEMERKLMAQCQRIRLLSSQEDGSRKEKMREEHQAIVDAIEKHDSKMAKEQILHHLQRTLSDYKSLLSSSMELQL